VRRAAQSIVDRGVAQRMNFRRIDSRTLGISLDETSTRADVEAIWRAFGGAIDERSRDALFADSEALYRKSCAGRRRFLAHPTFNRYHSETEMLRYLRRLADRDIALDRAMISARLVHDEAQRDLEMIPGHWPEFGEMHPFAPIDQAQGYVELVAELERMLCVATAMQRCRCNRTRARRANTRVFLRSTRNTRAAAKAIATSV
jgi:glycine dehydrogenase